MFALLRFVWARIGDISVAAWVFSQIMTSLGASVVAAVFGVPPYLWIPGGVLIFVLMAHAAEKSLNIKHKYSQKTKLRVSDISENFSVSAWNHVNLFCLFQAACLWQGLSPPTTPDEGEIPPQARGRLHSLILAVNSSHLLKSPLPDLPENEFMKMAAALFIIHTKYKGADAKTTVQREDLKKYAESINEHPEFLFGITK